MDDFVAIDVAALRMFVADGGCGDGLVAFFSASCANLKRCVAEWI